MKHTAFTSAVLLNLVFAISLNAMSSCNIPIERVGTYDPVILRAPQNDFWTVKLDVEENQQIALVCAGKGNHLDNFGWNASYVKFQCKSGEFYYVNQNGTLVDKYKIEDQTCRYKVENELVKFNSDPRCFKGLSKWNIRFETSNTTYFDLITICRDEHLNRTQYTYFKMKPDALITLKAYTNPRFKGDDDQLYKNSIQQLKNISTELVGNIDFSQQNNQLARGHLTAGSDFVLGPMRDATYNYYNVAPQWQAFNGGNWANVERDIRIFVGSVNRDVEVYTGIYGNLTLDRIDGGKESIYLDMLNKQVPVPKYFWRVLDLPDMDIAIIGTNNIFAQNENDIIEQSETFCQKQECPTWLKLTKNSHEKGYIFCCHIDSDFLCKIRVNAKFQSGLSCNGGSDNVTNKIIIIVIIVVVLVIVILLAVLGFLKYKHICRQRNLDDI